MFDQKEILKDLFNQVSERVFQDYGLYLDEMRDLHTGAIIGTIHYEVFETALIDEGALDDSDDGSTLEIETLADALLVRSLASARPSPALNRPTTQSLKRLLQSRPVVVCAYLMNRYKLSDWRKLNHRNDSWFDDMLHRVKVWEQLTRFADNPDRDASERSLRALAHWLLELDSKCNLHQLTPLPGWFEAFLGIDSIETFELFVEEFALIATPLIDEADRRFAIGNRMASSAYVQSWFDNPILSEKKVEIAGRIKGKSRQWLKETYGDVQIGAMIEDYKTQVRTENRDKKTKQDARIIKGRSARGKSAKLVNKHSQVLDNLFRSLGAAIEAGAPAPSEPTPKPSRAIGLPMFVKKD